MQTVTEPREQCRCPAACLAVPEQDSSVTDARPCPHCPAPLGGWKLPLNRYDGKAVCVSLVFLHWPLGRCVWVSLVPRVF